MTMQALPTTEQADYLKMRITSISEAASRSRWLFGASIVASSLLLTAIWNELFSWSASMAVDLVTRSHDVVAGSPRQVLDDEYLKDWAQSLYIASPVIGVKIAAADVGVIGAIALLVLSLWHYSALRRENHLIYDTVRETTNHFSDGLSYVFHGIVGTQLFATVSRADQPFRRLDESTTEPRQQDPVLRGLVKSMFMLPVIAVTAVIVGDIYSLMWPSPFRVGDSTSLFFQLSTKMRYWAVARIAFAIAISLLVSRNTLRAAEFQGSTEDLLRDVHSLIHAQRAANQLAAQDTRQHQNGISVPSP